MASKIEQIIQRSDRLFTEPQRTAFENIANELTEFMLNNQHGGFFNTQSSTAAVSSSAATALGAKKTRRVYDSTAPQATQDLASAFQGTLTNPATIWSKLRYHNEALNNDEESVQWLEEVNKVMHNQFNESNFNTEIAKGYQSFVALANMVIFQEERDTPDDSFGGFRFTALHISQVAWTEDKENIVDTIYRRFNLSAKQAFEKWGDKVHAEIKKVLEKDPDREFSFLHCVAPRDPKKVKLNDVGRAASEHRPVESLYIDTEHHVLMEEGGYYEMPVFVARWSLMPDEKYGRGPGHLALPDTRTLNRLKQRGLEAIDLQVRPPIFANQRDVFGQLDLRPGGISIVKDHNGVREFISQARSDILQFSVEELRNSIRSIFFLDKLLLPPRTETGEMTAFEVSQRIEQMQRVLGPTLSRLNHELLNPLIIRAFKMLLRSGLLPEAPRAVLEAGIDVEIVFVNQLARAQQIQDVNTIQQWVQGLAMIAQLDPAVVDMIDGDGIAKHTAKILGVPEIAVANDEDVAAVREQRAQQAQQAQALEAGVKTADMASKLDGTGGQE